MPECRNWSAYELQFLKPMSLEAKLHNKRGHRNENLVHHHKEQTLLTAARESP